MRKKTIMSPRQGFKMPRFTLPVLVGLALLIVLVGGVGLYVARRDNQTPVTSDNDNPSSTPASPQTSINPLAILSETATPANASLISQGEKILLDTTPQKQAGAVAFAQKNWDEAIAQYQEAADADPNDPESTIYLNNAKAKEAGNPLTMAVVVPITPSANEAKEVLRGVALAQEEFNQSQAASGRLLEAVIVNDDQTGKTLSLAEELIDFPNILGVLGHGVDSGTRQAMVRYERDGLAVLSPVSASVTETSGQTTLRTISLAQQEQELLETYLQQVGETLADYAAKEYSPASVAVFYNSDSPYSQALKTQFVADLSQGKGNVVKEVDVTASPSFDATAEMESASQAGANIAFLALSKNKVDTAIALAEANANQAGQSLRLMGGDELYNPTILTEGDDAVEGMVLAVPWSWQPSDPFATQAADTWKGRISWRTATAYDATQALATAFSRNSSRSGVAEELNKGIPISGTAKEFKLFNEIPLVKAVPGSSGPTGSRYQFDPVE
jgi:ABC-type branched-subunit amino acid transport system substrate-binding protein